MKLGFPSAQTRQQDQQATSASAGSTRTPLRGEPDTTAVFPDGKGGSTTRPYGPDGRAVKDIDRGHDHGAGDPHVHDIDWSGDKPKRGPGRAPKPGEVPDTKPEGGAQPESSSRRVWNRLRSIPPKPIAEAGTTAIVIYLIVSEGSRLIPVRNFVPVP